MIPIVISLTVLLAGCGKRAHVEAGKANKALLAAIEEAKTVKDPWSALKLLESRETAAFAANNPCVENVFPRLHGIECGEVPSEPDFVAERVRYLGLSVAQSQPGALNYLYSDATKNSKDFNQLRKSSADHLLKYADTAGGKPGDQLLLMAAGQMIAEGSTVVVDTGRAVGYYARAWSAGEAQAANEAARIFLSINDMRNAYFWSLRCTGGCRRDYPVFLGRLQEHLSPEAAKQAQQQAVNPSLVELETSIGG